jgi:hypothetical protein
MYVLLVVHLAKFNRGFFIILFGELPSGPNDSMTVSLSSCHKPDPIISGMQDERNALQLIGIISIVAVNFI